MKRGALFLLMFVATWSLSGCTLIGLGVGATMPKEKVSMVEEEATHADPGDIVRLQMTSKEELTGIVGTSDATSVQISPTTHPERVFGSSPSEPVPVPIDHIRTLRVLKTKRVMSNHALQGLAYGLAVDSVIAIIGAIVYGLSQTRTDVCLAMCHW